MMELKVISQNNYCFFMPCLLNRTVAYISCPQFFINLNFTVNKITIKKKYRTIFHIRKKFPYIEKIKKYDKMNN